MKWILSLDPTWNRSSLRPSIPLPAAPAQSTSKQESLSLANFLVEGDPHLSYLLLILNSQDMRAEQQAGKDEAETESENCR